MNYGSALNQLSHDAPSLGQRGERSSQPDVPNALERLESEISEVSQALNVLHDRLTVVMQAEPPTAVEKDGTMAAMNGACAVSGAIRDHAQRLVRIRTRIVNMIERLQV